MSQEHPEEESFVGDSHEQLFDRMARVEALLERLVQGGQHTKKSLLFDELDQALEQKRNLPKFAPNTQSTVPIKPTVRAYASSDVIS